MNEEVMRIYWETHKNPPEPNYTVNESTITINEIEYTKEYVANNFTLNSNGSYYSNSSIEKMTAPLELVFTDKDVNILFFKH